MMSSLTVLCYEDDEKEVGLTEREVFPTSGKRVRSLALHVGSFLPRWRFSKKVCGQVSPRQRFSRDVFGQVSQT